MKVIRIFSLKQTLSITKSCPGPFNHVFRLGLDTGDNFIDRTPFCGAGIGVPLRVAGRLRRTLVGVPRTEYANDHEHDFVTVIR